VASGQPQPTGPVLWTRLTGEHLPPEVAVDWELAEDEAFQRVAARGSETAASADAHSLHANDVADLKVDFDDPQAPVVASEFCGTSISSQGAPQARLDGLRGHNPHLHWARSDQRGCMQFRVDRESMQAQLQVVQDVRDPLSPVGTAARFAVAAQRPGVQAA
jgi:phosphodiesterase/alkaline phosphatase D-like protein